MKSIWKIFKGIGRLLKVAAVILVALVTVAIAGLIGVYSYFSRDLPDIKTVSDYRPYLVSTVYGSDGTPIGEFWNERRILVEINEIPPLLISAFIAAEDSRFFEHRGVDFKGTLRAFFTNLKTRSMAQGGSTITQQVTRSLLLSRKKAFSRKIKEAILATRLERTLTKDQILHLYLNQIFFGNHAYGVKAAAHNYFHKELKDLKLAEMALLAGLPRAPISYSPLHHPGEARERQTYVLNRLVEEGIITPQERQNALNMAIQVYSKETDKETNITYAPHLMEYLRTYLLEKYGADKLYHDGLKVYTTINPSMQKAANVAVQRGLEVVDRRTRGWRGNLGHIDPSAIESERLKLHQEITAQQKWVVFPPKQNVKETPILVGEIYKAIVTGFQGEDTKIAVGFTNGIVPKRDLSFDANKLAYDVGLYFYNPTQQLKMGDILHVRAQGDGKFSFYQPPEIEGALFSQETATGFVRAIVGGYDFKRSEFNRAMDALRQPGSSFKMFVYSAALDKGYTLRSLIPDSPFSIPVGDETWAPHNYDEKFRGATTVHNAIVHSYNVPTARVGYHIRLHYLTAYVRKLGITTPIFKYPSMTLGANGVHLNEMTAAYAVLPSLGVYHPPVFVLKILDQKGNVLEEYAPPVAQTPAAEPQTTPAEKNADLNAALYDANRPAIEKDQLSLYPSELKVLYGGNIPTDHVMTPQTAYLMTRVLQDVVKMGTGQRVARFGKPVAGKTGTSNDETDTWFIGFTPDLACGVWVGYDQVRKIGKGEQGGKTAAPIFLDFMQTATQGLGAKDFPMPDALKGKDTLAVSGGSAKFSDYVPLSVTGLSEGGSSEDRASDFMEADINTQKGKKIAPPKEMEDPEEGF